MQAHKLLQVILRACVHLTKPFLQRSYGVTVSTLDSESSDRSSNPRRTYVIGGGPPAKASVPLYIFFLGPSAGAVALGRFISSMKLLTSSFFQTSFVNILHVNHHLSAEDDDQTWDAPAQAVQTGTCEGHTKERLPLLISYWSIVCLHTCEEADPSGIPSPMKKKSRRLKTYLVTIFKKDCNAVLDIMNSLIARANAAS